MIQFNFEIDFALKDPNKTIDWISQTIVSEGRQEGDINYIFCDDDYLHKINVEFLNHDTLTDIISFDYSVGKIIHGDVFISVERVRENAQLFKINFEEELYRVVIHGILHYCGYKDNTHKDKEIMRRREDLHLKKFKLIL
ncbi:MAG TPA: rRNA maturation RNase YbeY [Flavobacteriaceae bacterium]|nr:rRNA maturation RNase YbeY [Flavobacteriaceae bacterium]